MDKPAMNNLKLNTYQERLLHVNYHLHIARHTLPRNHNLQPEIMKIINQLTKTIETDRHTPDSREGGSCE